MKLKRIFFIALVAIVTSSFASTSTVEVTETQNQTVLICTGKYATKYHSKKCAGLQNCKADVVEVSLKKAKENGYTACGHCYR